MEFTVERDDILQHHGILGQKWGVRRYQNEDGSLTNAGKKRYDVSKDDIRLYGERGAKRIAKRREKGDSHQKARGKELGLQLGLGALALAAIMGTEAVLANPETGKAINRIINSGKKAYNDYNNVVITGKDGSILTSYHEKIKVGQNIVNSMGLIRRAG